MLRSALVIALAIPASGCFHTQLTAPPSGAALPERLAAYRQLRPAGQLQTITVSTSQYGASVSSELDLVLAGGETVRHADDLLPVVDPESPTAHAARRSAAARGAKWGWILGGSAVSVLGFGIMMSGLSANGNQTVDQYDPDTGNAALQYGAAVMIAGALAGTIGGYYYTREEQSARAGAFGAYGDDLRERLDLCVAGMEIVDCAATRGAPGAPSAPPTPMAPPPAPLPLALAPPAAPAPIAPAPAAPAPAAPAPAAR